MRVRVITPENLREVPVFPLPGTVLLPRTLIQLHVFEPRYRVMTEDCIEGTRLLVIAMFDPNMPPDEHGRPAIHPVAGLGALRRSIRLPDGRFNIVLEGIARVDINEELPPDRVYRRANARVVPDVVPSDEATLSASVASVRALCNLAVTRMDKKEAAEFENLTHVEDPGQLADMVAAAVMNDSDDRQSVLAEADVDRRLQLVAGTLGASLLQRPEGGDDSGPPPSFGWGVPTGEA